MQLSDAERELTRHALRAYLDSFGHDEADTVEDIKRLISRFDDTAGVSDNSVVTD